MSGSTSLFQRFPVASALDLDLDLGHLLCFSVDLSIGLLYLFLSLIAHPVELSVAIGGACHSRGPILDRAAARRDYRYLNLALLFTPSSVIYTGCVEK
jgi:hypothetical protein